MKQPRSPFSIRLDPKTRRDLEVLAKDGGRSIGAEIRLAIREHLEKEGDTA